VFGTKSETEEKEKKRSSLKEGIEPSAIFISDFGGALLLALLGLIGLFVMTFAFAFIVAIGLFIAAYSIAFGFSYLISWGEVERAGEYARAVETLKMKESEGTAFAKGLVKTRLYFALILFVYGGEEAIRFLLNTGPANVEIWAFRLGCLAVYVVVIAVFANRFSKWRQFKRTGAYKDTLATIRKAEADKSIVSNKP
jgi:glucan phosphoethanolaminetransferase (alkaline phosphatase superfamily)